MREKKYKKLFVYISLVVYIDLIWFKKFGNRIELIKIIKTKFLKSSLFYLR